MRWRSWESMTKSRISIDFETSIARTISTPLLLNFSYVFDHCGRARAMVKRKSGMIRIGKEKPPTIFLGRVPRVPRIESEEK